jgi:hypothetical protein
MCLLVNQVKNLFISLCRESGCHKNRMGSGLQFERSKVRFFLRIEKRKAAIIRQISRAFPRFFLNFGFAF